MSAENGDIKITAPAVATATPEQLNITNNNGPTATAGDSTAAAKAVMEKEGVKTTTKEVKSAGEGGITNGVAVAPPAAVPAVATPTVGVPTTATPVAKATAITTGTPVSAAKPVSAAMPGATATPVTKATPSPAAAAKKKPAPAATGKPKPPVKKEKLDPNEKPSPAKPTTSSPAAAGPAKKVTTKKANAKPTTTVNAVAAAAAAAAVKKEATIKMTTEMYLAKAGLLKMTSFTPPRDLTLGGKKLYKPNLNVQRQKNTNVRTSKDTTQRGGRGGQRGGERGGGRGRGGAAGGRGGSNLIQTTGLFSEGAGAILQRKTSSSFGGNSEKNDTAATMRRPIITKSIHKIDIQKDEEYVREILESTTDDFDDEGCNMEEMPVKLSAEASLRTKMETEGRKAAEGHMSGPPENIHAQSLKQLFESKTQQFFVTQLPDTLPYECGEEEEPEDEPKGLRTTKPPPKTHSLKEMQEGKVGKIVRYKSGRVKVTLGESTFDLQFGMEPSCVQHLMSVSHNDGERSANIINLGPINAKVTLVPDFKHMLHQHDLKVSRDS